MKVLVCGGGKTHSMAQALIDSVSDIDVVEEPYLQDIRDLFDRGEYFDRAVIAENAVLGEGRDEIVSSVISDFIEDISENTGSGECIFFASNEEYAGEVYDASIAIHNTSAILMVDANKISTKHISMAAKADISRIPAKVMYNEERHIAIQKKKAAEASRNITWSSDADADRIGQRLSRTQEVEIDDDDEDSEDDGIKDHASDFDEDFDSGSGGRRVGFSGSKNKKEKAEKPKRQFGVKKPAANRQQEADTEESGQEEEQKPKKGRFEVKEPAQKGKFGLFGRVKKKADTKPAPVQQEEDEDEDDDYSTGTHAAEDEDDEYSSKREDAVYGSRRDYEVEDTAYGEEDSSYDESERETEDYGAAVDPIAARLMEDADGLDAGDDYYGGDTESEGGYDVDDSPDSSDDGYYGDDSDTEGEGSGNEYSVDDTDDLLLSSFEYGDDSSEDEEETVDRYEVDDTADPEPESEPEPVKKKPVKRSREEENRRKEEERRRNEYERERIRKEQRQAAEERRRRQESSERQSQLDEDTNRFANELFEPEDYRGSMQDDGTGMDINAGIQFNGVGDARRSKPNKKRKKVFSRAAGNTGTNELEIIMNTFKTRGSSLVVTGGSNSGKSLVASNIANVISKMGYSVLVVDMDTCGRSQAYISKDIYDIIHSDGTDIPSLRMAVNNDSGEIGRYINVVRPGYHLLTVGLAADSERASDILDIRKINRFVNVAKSSYNVIVFDIPFDELTTTFTDILFTADNTVYVVDTCNHGIMDMTLKFSNIESDEAQSVMFNATKILFNKVVQINSMLGYKVKTVSQILQVMDAQIHELIGVQPEFLFSQMHTCGIIQYSQAFERFWFSNSQVSDTTDGEQLFVEILTNLLVKDRTR